MRRAFDRIPSASDALPLILPSNVQARRTQYHYPAGGSSASVGCMTETDALGRIALLLHKAKRVGVDYGLVADIELILEQVETRLPA